MPVAPTDCRATNASAALSKLLALGAVPIINENDAVAVDEIRFGDNDELAAMVGPLCGADLVVLLSDVDGVLDEAGQVVPRIDDPMAARALIEGDLASRPAGETVLTQYLILLVVAGQQTPLSLNVQCCDNDDAACLDMDPAPSVQCQSQREQAEVDALGKGPSQRVHRCPRAGCIKAEHGIRSRAGDSHAILERHRVVHVVEAEVAEAPQRLLP